MKPLSNWQILGLQFGFAAIAVWAGRTQKELNADTIYYLKLLIEDLDGAILGLEWNLCIHNLRLRDKFERGRPDWKIDDYIKIERAYGTLKPILPRRAKEARKLMKTMRNICSRALEDKATAKEKKNLHSFCREFLTHLEQLEYGKLAGRTVM